MIEIRGVDKAILLSELYRRAGRATEDGYTYCGAELPMEMAEKLIRRQMVFRFLMGRPLKVDLSGDELDEADYDRSNGRGAAKRAVMTAWARGRRGGT